MTSNRALPTQANQGSARRRDDRTIGMKLHTRAGANPDAWRVAEFYTDNGQDFQIAIIRDQEDGPIDSVSLSIREAKALRHWLDAALRDS